MAEYMRGIWNAGLGDFDPTLGIDRLAEEIDKNMNNHAWRKIFAPRCGFTTRVVTLGEEDDFPATDNTWFVRSKDPADGGIVESPDEAVMIFNADCPIVALFDENLERLAVLHAGLDCLLPRAVFDRRADKKQKRGIIEVCFEDHNFQPASVRAFVGFGIGPCCYGIEHRQDILQDSSIDIPMSRATRGSRSRPVSQRSVDLFTLAVNQLTKLGVPDSMIEVDYECTSCSNSAGVHRYHSNARSYGSTSRNASFAWFVH